MSCFVDFQLKVSFLENFFESRKADFELDTQIVSHEQRALTAGRQIVDVQKGTTKGFLYRSELKTGKEMPQKGYVEMEYNCDQEWLEKGFTMFSQLREYTQSHPF